MPRQDPKAPAHGQDALFDPPTTKDSQRTDGGRHTRAMAGSLEAARTAGLIDAIDEGLATVLLHGAWALDSFEAQNKPYGASKTVPAIVEALRESRMTPDARATETEDRIADLVTELSTAEDDDHTVAAEGWVS
ncbi:hypothetical protein [Corynebacterium kalidii]